MVTIEEQTSNQAEVQSERSESEESRSPSSSKEEVDTNPSPKVNLETLYQQDVLTTDATITTGTTTNPTVVPGSNPRTKSCIKKKKPSPKEPKKDSTEAPTDSDPPPKTPPTSRRRSPLMPLAGTIEIDADIAKVIGIEDTEIDDDLLTHSGLKKKNRVRRRRQERKLRQLAQIRSTER